MGTRVQVLSDLHLEFGQQYRSYTFPATAPFLLLAGDVGCLVDYDEYLAFLQAQVSRYEKVFLVLGNHEFFGLDYDSGLDHARRLLRESSLVDKLVLLDKGRWDDPSSALTILGCTLWSAIPESARVAVENKVGDLRKIERWSVDKHNQIHAVEIEWLRNQVAELATDNRQVIVATHHAPCLQGTSRPEQLRNPWTPAFATELLDDEKSWRGVNTWVFGHTHYSADFVRNGIRVLANQRGYVLPENDVLNGLHEVKNRKEAGQQICFNPALSINIGS